MKTQKEWSENKLMGDFAENLVKFLINSTPHWKCVKFGIENHINDLKKNIIANLNDITKKIKSMPDFIVFNDQTDKTFFVEVKYRGFDPKRIPGKIEYKLDFLEEYENYWPGTKLIIISPFKPHISIINLKEAKPEMCRKEYNGKKLDCYWNFIEIQKEISSIFENIPKEVIQKAIDLIPKKNGNN